jgi:hypothetical protein
LPREQWGYPPKPEHLEYLWGYFIQLHNARRSGMALETISFSDIHHFQIVRETKLLQCEIDAILLLDRCALKAINNKPLTDDDLPKIREDDEWR